MVIVYRVHVYIKCRPTLASTNFEIYSYYMFECGWSLERFRFFGGTKPPSVFLRSICVG